MKHFAKQLKADWQYAQVLVKGSGDPQEHVWAMFADWQEAREYADMLRRNYPNWVCRVVVPADKSATKRRKAR